MRASEIIRSLMVSLLILASALVLSPNHFARERIAPQSNADHIEVRIFLAALKKAVAADDRNKVASMFLYPIVIDIRNRGMLFRTPASLLASYDLIFTPHLKKIIAEAKADDLFRNYKGVMINDGEVWFEKINGRGCKIITINRTTEETKEAAAENPSNPTFKVHPKIFSMIGSWLSDSESPVVTEINLDAVATNGNQFDQDEIKQQGNWFRVPDEEGRGYMTYEVLEQKGNQYTVLYSENGGGTMTTSAIIEFVVERRQFKQNGKLKSFRALRVLSYTER